MIDDGAAGVWCNCGSGDELFTAAAVAVFVFEEMVDEEDDDDGKRCSA